jgi:hypothetical protein
MIGVTLACHARNPFLIHRHLPLVVIVHRQVSLSAAPRCPLPAVRKLAQGMGYIQPSLNPTLHVSSFAQIYDTLPPDAQRTLLEAHLVPLLDNLPDSVATKVLDSAKEMQTRLMAIPKLDYYSKRTELEGLLNEIERDQKQSLYIKERSEREQLFEETMDSLSNWVNDIWSVIFEYQTNFRLAHQCLILAAEMLRRMFAPHGGCVLLCLSRTCAREVC